jgi:hypothetical protein
LTLSVHRLGGRAHLAAGEWELARRYLEKGLTGTRGAEREETLARLVIACRRLEETADAVRYRGLLKRPVTPEVEEILAERDPVLLAAGARKTPAAPVEPEPERVAPTPDRRARRPGPASLAADDQRLLVLPRSSWSPNPMRPNVELMDPIDKITIHHTGGDPCQDSSRSDAASTIRKIQRYHQRELHWADIGYHYIIDRNGSIWQGRPLRYQGAHAQGARNRGNIGIVVLGNFSRQEMTAAQQESLVALLTRLCDHFAIPASRVYTHREILQGKTACPGPALSRFVSEIRDDLRRRTIALGK